MITKDMNILEAVQKYPEITTIFRKYGLGWVGCMVASGESIGEGLEAHGLDSNALIKEMNELIAQAK